MMLRNSAKQNNFSPWLLSRDDVNFGFFDTYLLKRSDYLIKTKPFAALLHMYKLSVSYWSINSLPHQHHLTANFNSKLSDSPKLASKVCIRLQLIRPQIWHQILKKNHSSGQLKTIKCIRWLNLIILWSSNLFILQLDILVINLVKAKATFKNEVCFYISL